MSNELLNFTFIENEFHKHISSELTTDNLFTLSDLIFRYKLICINYDDFEKLRTISIYIKSWWVYTCMKKIVLEFKDKKNISPQRIDFSKSFLLNQLEFLEYHLKELESYFNEKSEAREIIYAFKIQLNTIKKPISAGMMNKLNSYLEIYRNEILAFKNIFVDLRPPFLNNYEQYLRMFVAEESMDFEEETTPQISFSILKDVMGGLVGRPMGKSLQEIHKLCHQNNLEETITKRIKLREWGSAGVEPELVREIQNSFKIFQDFNYFDCADNHDDISSITRVPDTTFCVEINTFTNTTTPESGKQKSTNTISDFDMILNEIEPECESENLSSQIWIDPIVDPAESEPESSDIVSDNQEKKTSNDEMKSESAEDATIVESDKSEEVEMSSECEENVTGVVNETSISIDSDAESGDNATVLETQYSTAMEMEIECGSKVPMVIIERYSPPLSDENSTAKSLCSNVSTPDKSSKRISPKKKPKMLLTSSRPSFLDISADCDFLEDSTGKDLKTKRPFKCPMTNGKNKRSSSGSDFDDAYIGIHLRNINETHTDSSRASCISSSGYNKWSLDETYLIYKGVQQGLTWAKIKSLYFSESSRTNVNIKDRWRIVLKSKQLQHDLQFLYNTKK